MKDIQKKLILLELENISSSYDKKIRILDNIIMYYIDEDTKPMSNTESNDIVKFEEKNDLKYDDPIEEENTSEQEKSTEHNEYIPPIKPEKPKVEELPSDIKLIYRKIMMVTHPDKSSNNVNKEEYKVYYKKAVDAKNTYDISEIIYIAYKLNLKEIFDIDIKYFDTIKQRISMINLESKGIENSPYWVWYYTDNDSLKNLMDLYIKKVNNK